MEAEKRPKATFWTPRDDPGRLRTERKSFILKRSDLSGFLVGIAKVDVAGSTPVSRSSVFSDLRPTYGARLGRETRGLRALLPGYRDDTSAFQSKVAIRTPDSRDA